MPVLQCYYETKEGLKMAYVIPFSKISHLSCVDNDKEPATYYMNMISGAKIPVRKEDYEKIYEELIKQEGSKDDNDLHDN